MHVIDEGEIVQADGEIVVVDATPGKLEKLAYILAKIKFLEQEIEAIESIHGIDMLRVEVAKYAEMYNKELKILVPTLTFAEDAILKAANVKGDSYREGSFKLVRKPRTVRSVLIDPFLDAYHDLDILKRIVKIEVGKAEAEIGKRALDQFVDKKTTYTYELQDLTK